jgi:hypothetical protein
MSSFGYSRRHFFAQLGGLLLGSKVSLVSGNERFEAGYKAPPNGEPPLLAIGTGRLLQEHRDGATFWDARRWTPITRIAAKRPRGVGALADGSLLFASAYPDVVHHLLVRADKVLTHPINPSELKSSEPWRVFSSVVEPRGRAWICGGDTPAHFSQINLDALADRAEASETAHITTKSGGPQTFTQLRDGMFVVAIAGDEFRRLGVGKDEGYDLPKSVQKGNALHLAAGSKDDLVWAADAWNGRIHLLEIARPMKVVRTIETNAKDVFSMASADGLLAAALVLSHVEPTFNVVVYDEAGNERCRMIPAFTDTLREQERYTVAIGDQMVAFGGRTEFIAWDLKGTVLHHHVAK